MELSGEVELKSEVRNQRSEGELQTEWDPSPGSFCRQMALISDLELRTGFLSGFGKSGFGFPVEEHLG